MNKLDPKKLKVELGCCITNVYPILDRKYTLTHSDKTGELFLYIDNNFNYDKIDSNRDEVLFEWKLINNMPHLYGYVHITNGDFNEEQAKKRMEIFLKELPLAIEALRYGDRNIFKKHPDLDAAPIYIRFRSSIQKFNKMKYFGIPADYR